MQDCSVECRIVQLNANFRQFSVQRLKLLRIVLIITEGMHGRLHAWFGVRMRVESVYG